MINLFKKSIYKKYINNEYISFLTLASKNKLIILYHSSMINLENLQKIIIPNLLKVDASENLEFSSIAGLQKIEEKEIDAYLFNGFIIIYNKLKDVYYCLNNENIPTRNTSDPINDVSVSGARDAFVESIDKNVALVQKRIKSNYLSIEKYLIGTITNTNVNLLYIKEKANEQIVKQIKEKLETSSIESLTNIGQLQSLLVNKKSLIPLLNYCSRPDWIATCLLKGRIIILMDGIPLALIAPSTFLFFIDLHDSLSENYYVVLFDRFLFATSLFVSIFFAPFVTAVICFYPEFFPLSLISTTINARKGIITSFSNEIIICEILFHLFRIAGSRFYQTMSASLLVIGSLLLGRAIIEAGIVSQEALFISSISVICSYIVSNNVSFNTSINILRWFLIILTITFGFIGLSVGLLLVLIYLASQITIDTPYMYPLAPFNPKALFESIMPPNYLKKKKGMKKNEKN